MIEIWLKRESNKFPFKFKFTGNDIYDLKKEVIVELAPKLNSFAAVDIGISSSTTKALFLDNFFVSDLALTTENKYECPWLVVFQERDKPNTLESALGNLLEWVLLLINQIEIFTRYTNRCLWDFIVFQERPKVQWLTLLIMVELLTLHFEPFPIWSNTTILVFGITFSYYLLSLMPDVVTKRFTTSSVHITEGRWYTLVTSSFAHKDIDDLLQNLKAILLTMPIIERLMKQKEAV